MTSAQTRSLSLTHMHTHITQSTLMLLSGKKLASPKCQPFRKKNALNFDDPKRLMGSTIELHKLKSGIIVERKKRKLEL